VAIPSFGQGGRRSHSIVICGPTLCSPTRSRSSTPNRRWCLVIARTSSQILPWYVSSGTLPPRFTMANIPLTKQKGKTDAHTLLTWFFAHASIPFYVVENPILRHWASLISNHEYKLPHRTSLRRKVMLEAEVCEAALREKFKVCSLLTYVLSADLGIRSRRTLSH